MTKKKPGFLPLEEYNYHQEMKRYYPNYPRLPKALVDLEKRRESSPSHKRSVLTGFRKRVSNWNKDHWPHLVK